VKRKQSPENQAKKSARKVSHSSSPALQRETFDLFDLLFKKLLRLSKKSVIAFVNRLYGTSYPPTAAVEYVLTESSNSTFKRRTSDLLIIIDGITYHLEAQSTVDRDILLRIIESDFNYARDQKTEEEGIRTLRLPIPKIIQIQGRMKSPQVVRFIMPKGEPYDYEAEVLNLQDYTVEEIRKKGLVLLSPFCILKLREEVKAAQGKTEAEREEVAKKVERVLEEVLKEIKVGEEEELIEEQDVLNILGWLRKLYEEVYGQYKELTKGVLKVKDDAQRFSEQVIAKAKKETRIETAKRLLADGIAPEKVVNYTRLSLAKVRALAAEIASERQDASEAVPA